MINWVPNKPLNADRVAELLQNTVKSNNYTNYGPNVRLLEKIIRDTHKIDDSKAVICVNNGTSAIHALISGIEMHGDSQLKWATQSFTFPASAQGPLSNVYIVDIDHEGGIDLTKLPPDVDGIIVTNVFGNLVDIDRYTHWAREYEKFLIFDNAATNYSFYKGKNSLNYGTACTVSFHHTKPVGFGEGGAIIVDKCYEHCIRRVINFGIDNTCANPRWDPRGSNYKMSDIAAVYIIQYLDNMDRIIKHHEMLYERAVQCIPTNSDIKLYPSFADNYPFVSCICLMSPRFNDGMIAKLLNHGIYCRKYYTPLADTPVATQFIREIICVPCTIDMSIENIDTIVSLLM